MAGLSFQVAVAKSSARDKEFGLAFRIALLEDGPGSYRFTFASKRGELSGRVTVGIEGPPDRRTNADREQAAKNHILAMSREFAEACEE
jgi:hypothetical protein